MSEPFLIRDVYSKEVVHKIATNLKNAYTEFDQKGFLDFVFEQLDEQTYSERKESLTNALIHYLPNDYEQSIGILLEVTPPPYETEEISDTLGRFYVSCFTNYISKLGLDAYDISVHALYEMTKSFSSEWDIRPFILKYPDRTFALLKTWALDENPHVRRLVSEGSRPNLPWGKKLKLVDQSPLETTLPILELLQNDTTEYVRRSVANHLNDLSKNNAELVVKTLTRWSKQNPTPAKNRMIHHALRSLIKQGHTGALRLIGFSDDFKVDLDIHSFTKQVKWGSKFEFAFSIQNQEQKNQNLLIDFIIGFQKKSGLQSDKVFKLKKIELKGGSKIDLSKDFSFKPISTRVYYPGLHSLAIQINGKIIKRVEFNLLKQ